MRDKVTLKRSGRWFECGIKYHMSEGYMKYDDVLEVEYKEQYNQYRWIGTMQSIVLTFYGAVASFSLFLMSKFLSDSPSLTEFFWPSKVLIFVGVLGVIVARGLIKSRSTQNRIVRYLDAIRLQMASSSGSWDPDTTVLRYRGVFDFRGFEFYDTGNIVTYLSLVFGLLLSAVGIFTMIAIEMYPDVWIYKWVLDLPQWIYTIAIVVAAIVLFPVAWHILGRWVKTEECNIEKHLCKLKKEGGSELRDRMRNLGIINPCLCCQREMPEDRPRFCPECEYEFRGNGWDGIDAHWKAEHENVMPYQDFWNSLCPKHRS